ncbi:MAG TPA: ABC transporter permease [Dehalococcoidia bacterium]|nr:ABC transporter permease [Dehalococcoidia bacterium]
MTNYLIRRTIAAVIVLFLLSIVVLRLVHWLPGDVLIVKLGQGGRISPDKLAEARKQLGIDRPLVVQYTTWLGHILRGDFGHSLLFPDRSVVSLYGSGLPITLELSLLGLIIALLIAIPVGVISAVQQDTWLDYVTRVAAILGLAVPGFWLGTLSLLYGQLWFHWTPPLRYVSFAQNPGSNIQTFILPSLILGFGVGAGLTRITRSSVLEALRNDYVRTARAKGLRSGTVIIRHVLRNSLIPVVTVLGLSVATLLGGQVILEQLFGLPGIGLITLNGVLTRDYTVIQGGALMLGAVTIFTNLIVDCSYAFLDPRIRYS